jgi:hypothetical protein
MLLIGSDNEPLTDPLESLVDADPLVFNYHDARILSLDVIKLAFEVTEPPASPAPSP